MIQTTTQSLLPIASTLTEKEIIAYLRRSRRWSEILNAVEQEATIAAFCQQFGIEITNEELQAAGDAFRLQHRLLGIQQTQAWLKQQRITLEEWSEGIRHQLLLTKLKEHLFGTDVDAHYINNRDRYRRVALSQILVPDLDAALAIVQLLREQNASFCALALEHSKGKQSQENGGFIGIRFLAELMPEIEQGISEAKEGEIIGPIQTKLGYHILRVEKWFPHQLSESAREQILESLFQPWLQEQQNNLAFTNG
ncbi:peptidylprolyl isomerase [Pleurocapsales cyanobacterium LEGE 06147]|nr:peptidylprolyl isomerase [Pleurocapsales cyanobacterium LEGE 06147]